MNPGIRPAMRRALMSIIAMVPSRTARPDGADGHIIDNDQKQGCCKGAGKAGQRVDHADLDLAQNRYCAF